MGDARWTHDTAIAVVELESAAAGPGDLCRRLV
jgi:hypothetical protein